MKKAIFCIAALAISIVLFAADTEATRAGEKMALVRDDRMKTCAPISIAKNFDAVFKKNGVVRSRSELSKKYVPAGWNIDLNSLAGNCDLNRKEDGYEILSPDGPLKISAPLCQVQNTATVISIEMTSRDPITKVRLGIEELGMFRPGKEYVGELSGKFEKKCILFNASALEHYDCVRPFLEITGGVTIHGLRIYQQDLEKTTYLEGEIVARSTLPDPKKSDYSDCRYTVHFRGNVIKGGVPCPREMVLVMDGFKDYKTLGTNILKKGDKLLCSIVPYETLPEEKRTTRQVDDLELFLLESYYVLGVQKIRAFADGDSALLPSSGVYFSDEKKNRVSIHDRHVNPPVSEELRDAQKRVISEDLEKINRMLEGYDAAKIKKINADFSQAWKAEPTKEPSGRNIIELGPNKGKYVWRRIGNSFFTLGCKCSGLISTAVVSDENLKAIVALKKALEDNGVQLILSVVPEKDPIVARIMNQEFRDVVDYQTYSTIKVLLEHGIEAITPSRESVLRCTEEAFVYNVGNDGHPSILIQKIVSEKLAERLARYGLPRRLTRDLFRFQEEQHAFWGYDPLRTYPKNCDIGTHSPGEEIKVRKPVLPRQYSLINKDSEILVIGNSFTHSPYRDLSGLVSWMGYYLETDVAFYRYSTDGPFTLFIKSLLADPEKYLKGKKVAIFQFSLSSLFGSQWYNISALDRQLNLLSAASQISTIPVQRQKTINLNDLPDGKKAIIGLLKGTPFRITGSKELPLAQMSPETNDRKTLIVIPVALVSGNVSIAVNGKSQKITASPGTAPNSYQTLIFEIPSGIKSVKVSAKGNHNSVFVVKDIEIWQ